jgi:hypothetical protein
VEEQKSENEDELVTQPQASDTTIPHATETIDTADNAADSQTVTQQTTAKRDENAKLDSENAIQLLEEQIRTTASQLNNDIDDNDKRDDEILATDLFRAARRLLREATQCKEKSARKLQNWIQLVTETYGKLNKRRNTHKRGER